jgi:hypothetical protein
MTEYSLDRSLLDDFLDGTLDPQDEPRLANEVASLMPFHAGLPTPIEASLAGLTRHLGGNRALLAWLDRFPGRPRRVARLFSLLGILYQYGNVPPLVTALRELRARTPYPPGLAGYLVPVTDDETLPSLAGEIEELLIDREDDAMRLAVATATVLHEIAPRAVELDPEVRDLQGVVDGVRHDLLAVLAGDA